MGGNTPKYGLIFHSSFIGRAGAKNKGRISRYLANKCSIASRIDAFSDESTTVFGSKLKEQVEDRLKFYETGDLPWKKLRKKSRRGRKRTRKKGRRRMKKLLMCPHLIQLLQEIQPLKMNQQSHPKRRKRRRKMLM